MAVRRLYCLSTAQEEFNLSVFSELVHNITSSSAPKRLYLADKSIFCFSNLVGYHRKLFILLRTLMKNLVYPSVVDVNFFVALRR